MRGPLPWTNAYNILETAPGTVCTPESVGTWNSSSPTLHSLLWIPCDQHSFAELLGQNGCSTTTSCQGRGLSFLPTAEIKARAEDGGQRNQPQCLAGMLGSVMQARVGGQWPFAAGAKGGNKASPCLRGWVSAKHCFLLVCYLGLWQHPTNTVKVIIALAAYKSPQASSALTCL